MSSGSNKMIISDEKPIIFLFENSLFLIIGAVAALVWANTYPATHDHFFGFELQKLFVSEVEDGHGHDVAKTPESSGAEGENETTKSQPGDNAHPSDDATHEEHHHAIDFAFLINDVLMALFFAIAAKEIFESVLPGGPLSGVKKAAMPLIATLGGILGPVSIYVAGVLVFSDWSELGRGWAIPTATDIAFSYLVARIIFGKGHPAIAFLLLLAIADDAAGLVIIAIFYPQGDLQLVWLLLCVGAMVLAYAMNKAKVYSFWWYLLIPGILSWTSFFMANVHPALGLVPIIPFMPHANSDLGLFVHEKMERHDTLNEFEHWWKNPVELILGLFGLCNAAVAFDSVGVGTWLVMTALIVGKPAGVMLCSWIGKVGLRLELPKGMDFKDTLVVGSIAGIGFTVALFVSTSAFPQGSHQLSEVKMGALASFGAAIVAFIIAKSIGIQKYTGKFSDGQSAE